MVAGVTGQRAESSAPGTAVGEVRSHLVRELAQQRCGHPGRGVDQRARAATGDLLRPPRHPGDVVGRRRAEPQTGEYAGYPGGRVDADAALPGALSGEIRDGVRGCVDRTVVDAEQRERAAAQPAACRTERFVVEREEPGVSEQPTEES